MEQFSHTPSIQSIQKWLIERVADLLAVPVATIDPTVPMADYGLASRNAVTIVGDLEEWLDADSLSPTLIWEYPTIEALAEYLGGKSDFEQMEFSSTVDQATAEPIAIIGMGCRFPLANGVEAFWQLLVDGVDAIRKVPESRWALDDYYEPQSGVAGKMNTEWGGFVDKHDQFDSAFFGLSPREASRMDPQQRFTLEVAWEALEQANISPYTLKNSQTGVFMGVASNDYSRLQLSQPQWVDGYAGTGNAFSVVANRLSYLLDLRGPSIVVDTACSSSLVSVHLACASLQRGECTLALAGGVGLILSPELTISFSSAGMMAGHGRCRTFDQQAEGYVRGEGCGLVVLKRLRQAEADGDRIIAVIRGTAVNQDGRSNGLTAPNQKAQESVIRQALANAKLEPRQISYVEAHGTGTPLGDPIEINALKNVLMAGREGQLCAIGAVKTNIGHLEAAAGIAGLIKTALVLQRGIIPPNLHFDTLNEHIDLANTSFVVPTKNQKWIGAMRDRYAGVSSFGFGGTNAHAVLQQPPTLSETPDTISRPYTLLPFSAKSDRSLQMLVQQYQAMTATNLHNVAYTAANKRAHFSQRLAIIAGTPDDLQSKLAAYQSGEPDIVGVMPFNRRSINDNPIFVFPGQGSQWASMGRELFDRELVFQRALVDCENAMKPFFGESLIGLVTGEIPLDQIDFIQPALFAMEVGLARLWESWGIKPRFVLGHSMGEIAAAHIAGILTLTDAARIICVRSRLLKKVSGQGGMLLVELSQPQTEQLISAYTNSVSIAVCNSPDSTVLAGDLATLELIYEQLDIAGTFCRWVKVDVASHSPQVDPLLTELAELLQPIAPQDSQIPFFSTVTGKWMSGSEMTADYWLHNLRQPVVFSQAVQALLHDDNRLFMEMSPHPILLPAIQNIARLTELEDRNDDVWVLPSLRRENVWFTLLESLGQLYVFGFEVDWTAVYPQGKSITLPTYAWDHQRIWFTDDETLVQAQNRVSVNLTSCLLGVPHTAPAPMLHPYWEVQLDLQQFPYLSDHQVERQPVMPAAAYLEMALAAGYELEHTYPVVLNQVAYERLLFLRDEAASPVVQTILNPVADEAWHFRVLAASDSDQTWHTHAAGTMLLGHNNEELAQLSLEQLQTRCTTAVDTADFYQQLAASGLHYGPAFQAIHRLWHGDQQCVAQLAPSKILNHLLDPTMLDAAFQTAGLLLPDEFADGTPYLPSYTEQMTLLGTPPVGQSLWVYAQLVEANHQTLVVDITIMDEAGHPFVLINRFTTKRLDRTASLDRKWDDWLYHLDWEMSSLSETSTPEISTRLANEQWLLFVDASAMIGKPLQDLWANQGIVPICVTHGEGFQQRDASHFEIDPNQPDHFQRLFRELPQIPTQIVYLWALDVREVAEFDMGIAPLIHHAPLHLIQAIAQMGWRDEPRLWFVTRGVHAAEMIDEESVAHASLWGLGRVIGHEHPNLRCTCLDLSNPQTSQWAHDLLQELNALSDENQIAWRENGRYVLRLLPYRTGGASSFVQANSRAYQLVSQQPGVLDRLCWQVAVPQAPEPNQLQVQVMATGLNFLDVLSAMGIRPDDDGDGPLRFGGECAGIVTAVGAQVTRFAVGDTVLGIAPGSFSQYINVNAEFMVHKPDHLGFADAATIPINFMTAYHALVNLADLQPDERVLIHSASGGTGMAAIQVAQKCGAVIFATAGTEQKRDYLRSLGIEHVMNSRSLDFATEVMELTHREGVDVVLNSLTGAAIRKGLEILAPYGRFMEIGKRDIYEDNPIGLLPFQKNLTYSAIDLARMAVERPARMGRILQQVMAGFVDGEFTPLPKRTYPAAEVGDAFRYMAQAQHIGKLVVTFSKEEEPPLISSLSPETIFRSDGAYLITGGLGGLGLAFSHWMIAEGAKHLTLVTRRQTLSASLQEEIDQMEAAGATVTIATGDMGNRDDVERIVRVMSSRDIPLRGVIHAAAVLDDGILLQQTAERFVATRRAKMDGAWYLHQATFGQPLDFFVLFSSVASLIGSPGQGNYAAANAFLDGLAHYRRSQGLVGLCINWGPWAEVGLAADKGNVGGVRPIMPQQGLELFKHLLQVDVHQVGVMSFNIRQWQQFFPKVSQWPLFSDLMVADHQATRRGDKQLLNQLKTASVTERLDLLEHHLCQIIAKVLRLPQGQIDRETPLGSLGFDSLMALELRNRLEDDLDLSLSATLIWNYKTVSELTPYLLGRMGLDAVEGLGDEPDTSDEPTLELSDDENNALSSLMEALTDVSVEELTARLLEES